MNKQRIIQLLMVVLVGYFVVSVGRSVYNVYEIGRQVSTLEDEVLGLQEQKDALLEDKEARDKPQYIEQEARNKLNLINPGDTVVVVDDGDVSLQENQSESNPTDRSTPEMWIDLITKGLN